MHTSAKNLINFVEYSLRDCVVMGGHFFRVNYAFLGSVSLSILHASWKDMWLDILISILLAWDGPLSAFCRHSVFSWVMDFSPYNFTQHTRRLFSEKKNSDKTYRHSEVRTLSERNANYNCDMKRCLCSKHLCK